MARPAPRPGPPQPPPGGRGAQMMLPASNQQHDGKGASSGPLSLLFSLDAERLAAVAASCEDGQEYEAAAAELVSHLHAACEPTGDALKLAAAVQEAKASSILASGRVELQHVGSYLRSQGFVVVVRTAGKAASRRPPKAAYLRQLRHSFLVVRGLDGLEGPELLVDLNFRDSFAVVLSSPCRAAPWFDRLLAALPQDWVGPEAALTPVVGLMAAGMALRFHAGGVPLPPWRSNAALLSKWLPEVFEDSQPPLVPRPDPALRALLAPYHAPFRAALRGAALPEQPAAAAAAGAAASADVTHGATVAEHPGHRAALAAAPSGPRPPSGVALATTSIKAAAAGAAAGALLASPAGGPFAAAARGDVARDIPRRIIVGFPDHHEQQAQQVQRPRGAPCALRPGAPQPQPLSATPGAQGTADAAAAGAALCGGTQAATLQPQQSDAGPMAAAADMPCALAGSPPGQEREQLRLEARPPRLPPAFATAGNGGIVAATAGRGSPHVVVSSKWLLPGAAQRRHVATAADNGVPAPGAQGAAAAAPEAPARQFKTLDQLLPRMRTVRLGAA